jgi:DNA-directed RNA polymerase sigma subunit (sigma70/sigma32)
MALQTEGRPATVEEIQEELSKEGKIFNEDQIKGMLRAETRVSSLDSSEIEDGSAPIDWISSESTALENVNQMDLRSIVQTMIGVLTPVQREVVIRKLGIGQKEPETFKAISEKYDRSPEWARQIYDKSIRKMKAKFIKRSSYMNI